jgi:undecaprenyl-diphosphatase
VKARAFSLDALIEWDRTLSQRLTLPPARVMWRRLAAIGAHLGDGWLWLVGSAVALALGSPATRWLVIWLGITVLCTVSVGSGIKYLLRRPRPVELSGFYSRRLDSYSFPSGHAIRVACIATALSITHPWWSPLLFLYAGLVALCRVALGVHYPSDVLAGLLLGGLGGALTFGVIL